MAVNLADESVRKGYQTLLWEVDESGDSKWLLAELPSGLDKLSLQWVAGSLDPNTLVRPTRIDQLFLIAADDNLQRTNNWFVEAARGQRLGQIFGQLEGQFDIIILDCPPGFGDANRTLLKFANLVVVPSSPAPLAMRGLERVRDFMAKHRGIHAPILPVFTMVDRRRTTHRQASADQPLWPIIPMRAEVEHMARKMKPLGHYAPRSDAQFAFERLWSGVEAKLKSLRVLRNR